jgi:hypothetical protein
LHAEYPGKPGRTETEWDTSNSWPMLVMLTYYRDNIIMVKKNVETSLHASKEAGLEENTNHILQDKIVT